MSIGMIEARLRVIKGSRKDVARHFCDDVRWNNRRKFCRLLNAAGIARAERALIERSYQAGCRKLSMGVH